MTVPQAATFSTLTQTVTLPRLHCSGPKKLILKYYFFSVDRNCPFCYNTHIDSKKEPAMQILHVVQMDMADAEGKVNPWHVVA